MAPQYVSHAPNNRLGTNLAYVNKQCSTRTRGTNLHLLASCTTKRTFPMIMASDVNTWLGRGVGSELDLGCKFNKLIYQMDEGVNM